MHGAGEGLNMLVFPLLMDTLCYTLDGEDSLTMLAVESD